MGKKHRNQQLWLCDENQKCTRCGKSLTQERRLLWWFQEPAGRAIQRTTTIYLCTSCHRAHLLQGENKIIIGNERYIVGVKSPGKKPIDLSHLTIKKKNKHSRQSSNSHSQTISHQHVDPLSTERALVQMPTDTSIPKRKNLAISKKERNLLINSQIVIEDYPWLYKFLKRHEHVRQPDIDILPHQHRLFIRDMLGDLLKRAPQEWAGDSSHPVDDLGDDKENWTRCSLCGQPNRYMYFIVNRINRKALNVGSECIKEFDFDFKGVKRTLAQLKVEMARMQRRTRLNEQFSGIASLVDSWTREPDKYSVVIPLKLEKPYLECGKEVKRIFDSYIAKKVDEDTFPELRALLQERKTLIQRMNQHANSMDPDSPFTPKREFANWLIGNQDRQTLEWLKEDGTISHRSACRIMHPDFMKIVISRLKSIMSQHSILLISSDQTGYVYTLSDHDDIKLHIKHRAFLMEFGDWMYGQGDNRIEPRYMLKLSQIHGRKSIEHVLNNIGRQVKHQGYSLNSFDTDYNEVDFIEYKSRIHSVLPLSQVLSRYKYLAFGLELEELSNLILEIQQCKTMFSHEQFVERQELREGFGKIDNSHDEDIED